VLAPTRLDGRGWRRRRCAAGGKRREVAIYIARAEKDGRARGTRWLEGAGSAALSSDGSGASSVTLVPSVTGAVAVMLDARAAMSPVHARAIEADESGPARLGPDVVVFVGPSPEGRTEVTAAAGAEGPIAFIPFAQNTSSFGLTSLLIGREPHLDAKVQWRMYRMVPGPRRSPRRGLRPYLGGALPALRGHAGLTQVLVLAPVEEAHRPRANRCALDFLSRWRRVKRAWLTWVVDGRSWIRAVRCG
jgi:hypothetical protein